MNRTVALYELEGHLHRGQPSGIARHEQCAPFACNSPVRLHAEPNPLKAGTDIVYEKCQCGKILHVWGVLSEPQLVNNDEDDGCA